PVDGARPCDDACPILHARFRGASRAVEVVEAAGGAARPVVVSASAPADGLQVLILREETQVEAARRARDSAVADLAHELQTPLAAQGASLELLRERVSEADPQGLDLVLALEAGTSRLRRLIDNLLESVRIESGQLAIRRVEVDLEEVFEDAVAMTRALAGRRRQRLEIELPHPPPALSGDPQRLGQLLVNLLSNASKYGPEGSALRLGAAERDGRVELWVEDEGPGFAEPAARAAARFRRGPSEPRQEGSGLGLWICRSILERHGGELEVTRTEGRTRVTARLPAGRPA
ncbi:MAG: HAMP domain-containing histidine kinase, partial [Thermoanaerobaculia bacterium]